MSAQTVRKGSNPYLVGDRVKYPGRRHVFEVRKVSGEYVYLRNVDKGLDSCNPTHYLDVGRQGEPYTARDKFGRTAGEAAAQTFKPGHRATYLILGDIWAEVVTVDARGFVSAKIPANGANPEVKRFRPSLFGGVFTWHEVGTDGGYSLRGDNGAFSEYSD